MITPYNLLKNLLMLSEMLSNVLLIKFAGVVVVSLGWCCEVTFEVSFNKLVEFSAFTLKKLKIKTIKVNSSFIAAKPLTLIKNFIFFFLLF